MLQHVFRPPQQQWETNSTVHRPLAPPQEPLKHTKHALFRRLATSIRDAFAIMKKREENWGWWAWQRKETGLKENDMHLRVIPVSLFSWDDGHGERETALKKVKALSVLGKLQNGRGNLERCRKITKYEKTVLSVWNIFVLLCKVHHLKKKKHFGETLRHGPKFKKNKKFKKKNPSWRLERTLQLPIVFRTVQTTDWALTEK